MNFEEAYERLEQILEKMNKGSLSLDDSLKLYEEADKLITLCQTRLTDAEKKIEILMKNRSGDILVEDGRPLTQEFNRTV